MPKRILIAGVMHESNSFSVLPTGLQEFRDRYLYEDADVAVRMADTATELGAYLAVAREKGWSVVHPVATHATPSGPVTRAAWEYLRSKILSALDPTVDGVALALHGALVAEHELDPEGRLLEAMRGVLGPNKPIVVTHDLHSNVSDRKARSVNALLAYETNPHVDQRLVAGRAIRLMDRMMSTGDMTRVHMRSLGMINALDSGRTDYPDSPHIQALRFGAGLLRPGIDAVSFHVGFAYADVPHCGASICVTGTEGDGALADCAAKAAEFVWSLRAYKGEQALTPDALVAELRRSAGGSRIVVADFTDNPGGGAYGDNVTILRALIEAGIQGAVFHHVYDPRLVEQLQGASPGATLDLSIGGWVDPRLGEPLRIRATVKALRCGDFTFDGPMWQGISSTMGACAILDCAGVDVIVASKRFQVTDFQQFKSIGLDAADYSVICLKSAAHFRAAFATIADRILLCDSGALNTRNYAKLPYRHVQRPIFPLDTMETPRAVAPVAG